MVAVRQRAGRPAKSDAPGLGRRDALRLALPDIGALIFRHEGQHLKDNVAEKRPHQVLAPPGVQQRHIQHRDVHPLLPGQNPPLLQNLPIVAPQAVYALDIEQVVFFQSPHHLAVLGTLKVLAGLLVHEEVPLRDGQLPHGDELPVLVLLPCADADIAVDHVEIPPVFV